MSYSIKKYKKQTKKQIAENAERELTYKQNDYLDYKETITFDIETVKLNELIKTDDKDKKMENLNPSSIKMFTFLIPKTDTFNYIKWGIKVNEPKIVTDHNGKLATYHVLRSYKEYYTYTYYNSNEYQALTVMKEFIVKRIGSKRKNIKIAGYNSDRFDSLVFKTLEEEKLVLLRKDRKLKDTITMNIKNSKTKGVYLIDIKKSSKSIYGVGSLEQLGEKLGIKKLSNVNVFSDIEKYADYNVRDCEIIYWYLKEINEKFFIKDNNVNKFYKKVMIKAIFDKYPDIEYINHTSMMEKERFYAAITEPYIHDPYKFDDNLEEMKYVDLNSLYTTSVVEYHVAIPTEDKEKKKLNYEMKKELYPLEEQNTLKKQLLEIYVKMEEIIEDKGFIDSKLLAAVYDTYWPDKFFYLKVKINGFNKKLDLTDTMKGKLLHKFPFNRKTTFSSFSYDKDAIYGIYAYELVFLCFFDFEVVDNKTRTVKKGEHILKEELLGIYNERLKLKAAKDPMEIRYKAQLAISYGIWITKNTSSEKVTSTKEIAKFDRLYEENSKNKVEDMVFYEKTNKEKKYIVSKKEGQVFLKDNKDKVEFKITKKDGVYYKQITKETKIEITDDKDIEKFRATYNKSNNPETAIFKLKVNGKNERFKILKEEDTFYKIKLEEYKEEITDEEDIKYLDNLYKAEEKNKIENRVFKTLETGKETEYTVNKNQGIYYKEKVNKGSKYIDESLPLLAWSTVSNARFIQYSLYLNEVFDEDIHYDLDTNFYYTDTDSYFLNKEFFEKMKANGLVGNKLGQYKDEYPNHTITDFKALASKSYCYTLKDNKTGEERQVKKLKGVSDFSSDIIQRGLRIKTTMITDKKAINTDNIQKRTLSEMGIFENIEGVSTELQEVYQEVKEQYSNKKK